MATAFEVAGAGGHGALEPGAPADVIEIDYARLASDLVSARTRETDLLLGRATQRHVSHVIAGGREIFHDGRVLGIDEDALNSELLAQARAGAAEADAFVPALERYQEAVRQFYNEGRHLR